MLASVWTTIMSFSCCCRLDEAGASGQHEPRKEAHTLRNSSELPADFEWPLIDGETIDPRMITMLRHMTEKQRKSWVKAGCV